jgi:flagellar biosynthesis protein
MKPRSHSPAREPAAVALRYRAAPESAPAVIASGRGSVAERILEAARAHGIPVHEDADLLQLLSTCELGAEIPNELYQVVAELLHYLYRLNGKLRGAAGGPNTLAAALDPASGPGLESCRASGHAAGLTPEFAAGAGVETAR